MWKAIAFFASVAPALAEPPVEMRWQPLNARPTVHRELLDCRSPVVAHEKRLKLDEPLTIGGDSFAFALDGDRITVSRAPAGQTRPAAPQAIGTSPAAYFFESKGAQHGLGVRLSADRRHVYVASLFALQVPLGNAFAYLIDSDLDGVIGSKGDGVLVPDSQTVGPMQKETQLWSKSSAVAIKRDETTGWSIATLADPKPANRDHGDTWRRLQWQRQASGLLPLRYDESLEKGMGLHIDYLVRNNRYSHYEDSQHPGYTEEGAKAGLTSVIGNLKKSYADAMQSQLLTMFHRGSLLAPELEASAMLLKGELFMCSTKMHVRGPLWGKPIVAPAHGMIDVPCEFNIAGESPLPFEAPENGANNKRGTAISVRHAQLYYTQALPSAPTLTLHEIDERGRLKEVDGDVYFPGKPPRSPGVLASNLGHVSLIPKRFLQPKTKYRATIRMAVPVAQLAGMAKHETFEYEWEFTTGEAKRK